LRTSDGRQLELLGTPDLLLLAGLNVGSDGFGRPLDRLGGHLQIGQKLQLAAPWSEGGLASDSSEHPPHAGREIGLVHIECHIGRKLSLVAGPT
jgi:hypothetical protein